MARTIGKNGKVGVVHVGRGGVCDYRSVVWGSIADEQEDLMPWSLSNVPGSKQAAARHQLRVASQSAGSGWSRCKHSKQSHASQSSVDGRPGWAWELFDFIAAQGCVLSS